MNGSHLNFPIAICATLAAFAESLFWTRVDYLPCCFARQFKLSDTSRTNSEVLPPHNTQSSGSSSRMAEAGLYFAWAIHFPTFCPPSVFLFFIPTLYSSHFRIESIMRVSFSGLQKMVFSQGYRKREVAPRIQAGLSPQPCLPTSPLSTEGSGKLWLFIHSSLYPPVVPLLAK